MSLNHEQARALIIEREQAKAEAEAQPLTIEYVGRVVEGNDGLETHFDVEGGIAALEAGCLLFASLDLEHAKLCDEDGSCELYRHPPTDEVARLKDGITKHWQVVCDQRAQLDTLRMQLDVLKGRAWAVMQEALDGAEVHPCDAHSEDVKAKTLAPIYQDLYVTLQHLGVLAVAVDPGQPGSERSVTTVYRLKDGELSFDSITEGRCQYSAYELDQASQLARHMVNTVAPLTLNKIEPRCSFCFQPGCNGECHGDDMMGGN